MSGQSAVKRRTPNLNLALINFNFPSWADEAHKNMLIVDGVITAMGGIGIKGTWQNSVAYVVGDRVSDPDDGQIYLCEVAHTSAATGTFSADRTANPTYWTAINNLPVSRGTWASSTVYNVGDVVNVGSYTYYFCIEAHTSSASFATDSAKWELIFDAAATVTDATAAKNAAETAETNAKASETAAGTSETNAATSASNASTSETNASNSASAAATSETNAGNSATAAATSETNAGTSETNAATSESNAATSASNAATSETNAGNSETKASEWADKAEDTPVEVGPDRFSSFHWAAKAEGYRDDVFNTGLGALSDVDFTAAPVSGNGIVFNGTAWVPGPAGGGMFKGNLGTTGDRSGDLFRVNNKSLTQDTTIAATENASVTGPLTVASDVTLTVASGGTLRIL